VQKPQCTQARRIVSASGCGVMVRDYGHLLADEAAYATRAKRIAELARDPVELVADVWAQLLPRIDRGKTAARVAFHPPCTLQHGMKIRGQVERLLVDAGFTLLPVADAHLCCGSAGTYSILQPELAERLKTNKLDALEANEPDVIATANIGCITHLQSGTSIPVRHWIELVDAALSMPETAQVPVRGDEQRVE
jgi:glycolate oxidase iron-sulfur subunit